MPSPRFLKYYALDLDFTHFESFATRDGSTRYRGDSTCLKEMSLLSYFRLTLPWGVSDFE
jgi:hypothetical protein